MRIGRLVILLASLAALLCGCSALVNVRQSIASLFGAGPPHTSLLSVQLLATPQANSDSATALDLVFVYDANAVDLLPKSGPVWFAQRSQLTSTLAGALDVIPLQIPPATSIPQVDLPLRHRRAVRVLSFANYIDPAGQPVGDLTQFKHASILLDSATVTYSER